MTMVPAIFGAVAFVDRLHDRRCVPARRRAAAAPAGPSGHGRVAPDRSAGWRPCRPRSSAGVRHGDRRIVRDRELGCSAPSLWWAFDIATLWACFHAFGETPPIAVIVMAYFVGHARQPAAAARAASAASTAA